jgi:hypothetical protein
MNKSSSTKRGIKLDTIAIIVFVILITFASIYVATPYFFPESTEIVYSKSYKNINAAAAYKLINKTKNLVIIDCRGLEGCGPC